MGSLIGSVEVLTTERDVLKDQKDKTEEEMKKKIEVYSQSDFYSSLRILSLFFRLLKTIRMWKLRHM